MPPKSNISSEENTALKNLRNDVSITIIPADKGNATVILNKTDYQQKLRDIIENGNYKIIKKDPTLTTERKLKSLLKLLNRKIVACYRLFFLYEN